MDQGEPRKKCEIAATDETRYPCFVRGFLFFGFRPLFGISFFGFRTWFLGFGLWLFRFGWFLAGQQDVADLNFGVRLTMTA